MKNLVLSFYETLAVFLSVGFACAAIVGALIGIGYLIINFGLWAGILATVVIVFGLRWYNVYQDLKYDKDLYW